MPRLNAISFVDYQLQSQLFPVRFEIGFSARKESFHIYPVRIPQFRDAVYVLTSTAGADSGDHSRFWTAGAAVATKSPTHRMSIVEQIRVGTHCDGGLAVRPRSL